MTEELTTREEDGILVITMNRPEARNAMNKAVAEGIAAALDRLDAEPALRVAVLTGAGGTFCSGMDLKGIPAAKRGLAAGAGGLMRLPDQIPDRVALELALTGNFIDAERAMALGLINRVIEGPAIDGAMALAREITENGPAAVRVSKQIMSESRGWSLDERWDRQGELLPEVFKSPDAREGAAAFAEKRKPNWTGA